MRWLVVVLMLLGCSTPAPLEVRGPLFEQRLAPRPGFVGLVNQVCIGRKGAACDRMEEIDYDLARPEIRARLSEVRMVCNVAGDRLVVCPDKPGLCSYAEKSKRFLWIRYSREWVEARFIPIKEGYQTLLDAKTWCAAQESLLGQAMFLPGSPVP